MAETSEVLYSGLPKSVSSQASGPDEPTPLTVAVLISSTGLSPTEEPRPKRGKQKK